MWPLLCRMFDSYLSESYLTDDENLFWPTLQFEQRSRKRHWGHEICCIRVECKTYFVYITDLSHKTSFCLTCLLLFTACSPGRQEFCTQFELEGKWPEGLKYLTGREIHHWKERTVYNAIQLYCCWIRLRCHRCCNCTAPVFTFILVLRSSHIWQERDWASFISAEWRISARTLLLILPFTWAEFFFSMACWNRPPYVWMSAIRQTALLMCLLCLSTCYWAVTFPGGTKASVIPPRCLL